MQAVAFLIYIGLGLFQLVAIMSGLEEWVGIHWLLATPIGLLLAYFPLVGTVIGMAGAVTAWGWSWVGAIALFFGPLLVAVVLALLSGAIGALGARKI